MTTTGSEDMQTDMSIIEYGSEKDEIIWRAAFSESGKWLAEVK